MNSSRNVAAQYFLNHSLHESELRHQVNELASAGYEEIYVHSRAGLTTPYFSHGWWKALQVIIEECKNANIKFAIWDEDCYPSGNAGNRIVQEWPELRSTVLEFSIFKVKRGTHCSIIFPGSGRVLRCHTVSNNGEICDITEFTGSVRDGEDERIKLLNGYSTHKKIASPHWRTWREKRCFALEYDVPDEDDLSIVCTQIVRPEVRNNTDILNTETGKKFVTLTHEEYLKRFGQDFSSHVVSSFTDEPGPAGPFPWTGRFAEEFLNDHGYQLLDVLPHLAINIDKSTPFIRHCYRSTQRRLQCSGLLNPIRKWCAQNGIKSVGHLTRCECFSYAAAEWPNELRCLKYLDIPCADPLGYYSALPDASAYHSGLKTVSSAARLFGKQQAGSDALAVTGNEVSLRESAFALDFQLAMGITYFNIHGLFYSVDGFRKDEAPPSLFYQHSEWPLMKHFIADLKSKCAALEQGEPVRRLAILYPSTTLECAISLGKLDNPLEKRFHELSEKLLSHHKDFDFIDELTLIEKLTSDSKKFRKDYDCLIIFACDFIKYTTAVVAEKFSALGGRLLVVEQIPRLLKELHAVPEPWSDTEITELSDELIESLPGVTLTGNGADNVFVHKRAIDSKHRYFLFNRGETYFTGWLENIPVSVPPGNSLLFDEYPPAVKKYCDAKYIENFSINFDSNFAPLPFWEVKCGNNVISRLNLLERNVTPSLNETESITLESQFLWSGEASPVSLLLEESTFYGKFSVFVNGNKVEDFISAEIRDCRDRICDITSLLKTGTTATVNRISFCPEQPDGKLNELPYLYGNFKTEYRHGAELPHLTGDDGNFLLRGLVDWRNLGRGCFSGNAVYFADFEVKEPGKYHIDCGRVEDALECYLNEEYLSCCWRYPYCFEFEAYNKGKYRLELRVFNGPANRDRMYGLPAGLFGPVEISKVKI